MTLWNKKRKACVAYLLTMAMCLSVIFSGQVITAKAAEDSAVIFETSDVIIREGEPVESVDYKNALEELKDLTQGTITVRYKAEKEGLMTLFSVANSENANGHTHVYVNGSAIGYEVRNGGTPGNVNNASAAASGACDGEIHTVTFAFSSTGTKAYYDGAKVIDNEQTGFVSSSPSVNTVSLGKTVRPGNGNQYKFSGTIYSVEVRSDVLSEAQILERQAPTVREEKEVQLPDTAYRTEDQKLFYGGYQGSSSYRIPSLLTTQNGTVLAAIDKRQSGAADQGNIDTSLRRSYDNGKTWTEGQIVYDMPGGQSEYSLTIDPAMVEDAEHGRIFMLVDMFPESQAAMNTSWLEKGSGYKEVNGKNYCILRDYESKLDSTHNYTKTYTIREHGEVWLEGATEADAVPTEYTVPEFHTGQLYKNDEPAGNIFLYTGLNAGELKVVRNMRIWSCYSDDDGETWSDPVDLTYYYKEDWMLFAGLGPGVGIQLKHGEHKGRLLIPIYVANSNWTSAQASAVIYSDDYGETWDMCETSPLEAAGVNIETGSFNGQILTESQLVEMNDGTLIQFFRNSSGSLKYAFSDDGGNTWSAPKTDTAVPEVYCQLTAVHYPEAIDGKEAVVLANPNGSGRNNGRIRIGLYDPQARSFEWKYTQVVNEAPYAYSCLTILQNGDIGLFYEENIPEIKYTSVSLDWMTAERMTLETKPVITNVRLEEGEGQLTFTLDFDSYMFAMGAPVLDFTMDGEARTAEYVSGNAQKQMIFRYAGDSSYSSLVVTNVSAPEGSEIGGASGELPEDAEFTFVEGGEAVCTCRIAELSLDPQTVSIPFESDSVTVNLKGKMKTSNCAREDHQFVPDYEFTLEDAGNTGAVVEGGKLTVAAPGTARIKVTGELNGKSDEAFCAVEVTKAQQGEDVNQPPAAKDPVPVQQVNSLEGTAFTAGDIAVDPENQPMVITRILSQPDSSVIAVLKDGEITLYGSNEGSTSMLVSVSDGEKSAMVTVPVMVAPDGAYDKSDYLSDHDDFRGETQIGWDTLKINKSPIGGTITLRDEEGERVTFAKGYGAHCTSSVSFNLPQGHSYKKFETYYGLDASQRVNAVVTFEILVDGKKVHTSEEKDSSSAMGFASVDIAGASALTLKATAKNNNNGNGHSEWAGSKLISDSSETVYLDALEGMTAEAKAYQEADYSKDSFAALKAAIESAERAAADENTQQIDVFHIMRTLKSAVEGLKAAVPATGVTLNHEALILEIGKSRRIYAELQTGTGEKSTDTITWSSSNPEVASVSKTGLVTAVIPGQAKIKALASSGKEAVCRISVIGDQEVTVSFDGGAGAVGSAPEDVQALQGSTIILPENTFTKENYEFAGWSDGAETYQPGDAYHAPISDVVLTAVWEKKELSYSITFTGGAGAQGTPSILKGTAGTVVTIPGNTFVRSGYEFTGWSDGSQTYAPGAKYTIQKDVAFTALWKQIIVPDPVTAPEAPANLKAAANKTSSIKLTWNKVNGASGYVVYRYHPAKKTWDQQGTVTGTSYTNKKLKAATAYQYRVKAYIQSGSQRLESEFSSALKTSTATKKPALKLTKQGSSKVKVSWKKVKGSSGYAVEMKAPKGKYTKLKEKGKKTTSLTKKIKKGKSYTFRMRTYIKTGKTKVYSAYSKPQRIRIK